MESEHRASFFLVGSIPYLFITSPAPIRKNKTINLIPECGKKDKWTGLIDQTPLSPCPLSELDYGKSSGSTSTFIEATEPNLLLLNFFLTASRSPPSCFRTREICFFVDDVGRFDGAFRPNSAKTKQEVANRTRAKHRGETPRTHER